MGNLGLLFYVCFYIIVGIQHFLYLMGTAKANVDLLKNSYFNPPQPSFFKGGSCLCEEQISFGLFPPLFKEGLGEIIDHLAVVLSPRTEAASLSPLVLLITELNINLVRFFLIHFY